MKTLLVDDEEAALEIFEYMAAELAEIEIVGRFYNGKDAIKFAKDNPIELAVLDIEMKGVDGILLGNLLRAIYPDILIIFITGYESYAMDAIKLNAAAYLLKPYTKDELEYAIETARLLSKRKKKKIFVKTFGHFDVFVGNKPIMFRSGKAKELLALLVDRKGGVVNTDQVICALWEDRPNDEATQNLCSKVAKTLQKELDENGVGNLLVLNRGLRRVDTEKFDCDFYMLLEGNEEAKKRFNGEYMVDYSWAEETMAQLFRYMKM